MTPAPLQVTQPVGEQVGGDAAFTLAAAAGIIGDFVGRS
jgi:hypothetical protein